VDIQIAEGKFPNPGLAINALSIEAAWIDGE
jgi:hypothetical protein